MNSSTAFWYNVIVWGLGILYFIHGDGLLYAFSVLCAIVCGVPWELSNWRIQQGYSNGEAIP